jgi:hypothetical protein
MIVETPPFRPQAPEPAKLAFCLETDGETAPRDFETDMHGRGRASEWRSLLTFWSTGRENWHASVRSSLFARRQ